MKQPLIGITADSIVEPQSVINQVSADFAPRDLKEAIIASGGIPVILPFPDQVALGETMAQRVLEAVDGVIIPGGPDVDPTYYGEEPIRALGRTAYQRDAFEIPLVRAAKEAKVPVFGICRGLQVMNVALGGTLYQDLPTQNPDSYMKHSQLAPGGFPTHHVRLDPSSAFYQALGEHPYVNSRHHQGVKEVAPSLVVTARAADGVVEALESEDKDLTAVQWHPENMWRLDASQLALFQWFVDHCRNK